MDRGSGGGHLPGYPPDYYRLLQVDPDAPQELIAEAYWHLAGRLRASRRERPGLREQLDTLNQAYATLLIPEQRSAYDATLPRVNKLREERARAVEATSRRSWVPLLARRRRSRLLSRRCDYYAALCLDPSAEPAIVDRAYSMLRLVHSDGLAQTRGLVLSNAELEEAHAVLADPDRRAEYDASRAAASMEVTAPIPQTVTPAPEGAMSSAVGAVPGLGPAASSLEIAQSPAPAPTTEEVPVETQRLEGPGETTETAKTTWPTKLGNLARWASVTARSLLGSAVESVNQRPLEVPDELLANRLRQEVQPVPEGKAGARSAKEPSPLGRLILRDTSGREEVVELRQEPITLGTDPTGGVLLRDESSVVAPEHADIRYSGGRFLLKSLAEHRPALIGGRPVVWAALEHGDEIQIGSWRIKFEMLQPQSDIPDHLRSSQPN